MGRSANVFHSLLSGTALATFQRKTDVSRVVGPSLGFGQAQGCEREGNLCCERDSLSSPRAEQETTNSKSRIFAGTSLSLWYRLRGLRVDSAYQLLFTRFSSCEINSFHKTELFDDITLSNASR